MTANLRSNIDVATRPCKYSVLHRNHDDKYMLDKQDMRFTSSLWVVLRCASTSKFKAPLSLLDSNIIYLAPPSFESSKWYIAVFTRESSISSLNNYLDPLNRMLLPHS
jgi:hypothetical protein